MPVLRLGYALEGGTDYNVVPILTEKLIREVAPEVQLTRSERRARRRGYGFIKELPSLVKRLEDDRVDVLVAVVDTDDTRINERLSAMREAIDDCQLTPISFATGLAVRSVEAWLLADEQAIGMALGGVAVNRQPDPERIDNPKVHLQRLISDLTGGVEFSVEAYADEIAGHTDLRVLRNRCRHFDLLATEIVNCVRQRLLQLKK